MSKIRNAFSGGKAFIAFLTAGDPTAEKTVEYILAMEEAGADLIEIGIPFSDPTAEGVVIQDANIRALKGGMTVDGVFFIVEQVRRSSSVPLVFLTYLNPVFHYGYERFFARCAALGVDGIIVPDLPHEEKGEIADVAKRNGVDVISLVAPTSRERIAKIARDSEGFVYVVSSMGVTGMRENIETDVASIVAAVRAETGNPIAIGFGIGTPAQAEKMARIADGAIVGSAIVRIVERCGADAAEPLREYVRSMKEAVMRADAAENRRAGGR